MKYQDCKTKTARIKFIKDQIAHDRRWMFKALVTIYQYQTSSEQANHATLEHNGVGFTGADAEILSSLATQYKRNGYLSAKQLEIAHKRMPKYARQLERIAQAKLAKVA